MFSSNFQEQFQFLKIEFWIFWIDLKCSFLSKNKDDCPVKLSASVQHNTAELADSLKGYKED